MPLPVRVPCSVCEGDRLFVWCQEERQWKCNDCGTFKREARPTQIDVFMRRRARKMYRRKESASDG